MKRFLPILILLSSTCLFAQSKQFIDGTTIRAYLNSDGLMFDNEDKTGFIIKTANDVDLSGTIFTSNIWFARSVTQVAADETGSHLSPGPIEDYGVNFDKVWKIAGGDIKNLIDDYEDGVIDYPISSEILSWPAKGNPYYENLLSEVDLAPFKDVDADGIYNPKNGDYPIIGEDLAHVVPFEMLFSVSHVFEFYDINVEFTTVMYTLECNSYPELENTIFTRHKITSKNSENTPLLYSIFTDNDLGCYVDDKYGYDINTHTLYSYNEDEQDGKDGSPCTSEDTFDKVPVHATTILTETPSSSMYYLNNAGNIPSAMGVPASDEGFYNIMNGKWQDGTPLTKGGNGYNLGSMDTAYFAFTGNPIFDTDWVQPTVDSFEITDIRSTLTFTKESVAPEEEIILDLAHHYVLDDNFNNIEAIAPALVNAITLRDLFNDKLALGCFSYTNTNNISSSSLSVFPNPTNSWIKVEGHEGAQYYDIYSFTGQVISQGNLNKDQLVDVSNLHVGMYSISLKDINNNIVGKAKFVVQ